MQLIDERGINMNGKKRLSIFLVAIMLLTTIVPSYAEILGDIRDEKNEVVTEINQGEENIDLNETEKPEEVVENGGDEVIKDPDENAEIPEVPEVPEGKKDIKIKSNLLSGQGDASELPQTKTKEYITADFEDTAKIKDILNLGNDFPVNLSSQRFNYEMDKIKIGSLTVNKSQYESNISLKDLGVTDYAIFKKVDEIQVDYKGSDKQQQKKVVVQIEGEDSMHEGLTSNVNVEFLIPFTGTEPTVTVKAVKVGSKWYIEESSKNGRKEVVFSGYEIKSLDKKSGEEFKFTAKLDPEEITVHKDKSNKEFYRLGKVSFVNEHNGGKVVREIIRERASNKFYYLENPGGELEDKILLGDLLTFKTLNRKNNETNPIKYYVRDSVEVTADQDKAKDLVKKMAGDKYQYDGTGIKYNLDNIANPNNVDIVGFDNERLEYRVKVNGGEVRIFNVIKGDTKYLEFTNDKIQSVKVKGQDKTGQKIDLGSLGNDVIEITTKDGEDLPTVEYVVQNKVFSKETNLYKGRVFEGLEGTKLVVNVIRQHGYKNKDKIEIKVGSDIFKLSDVEEKEITVKKDLETPFYFSEKDKVRYKVLYITKYGDNWDSDGDYNIETIPAGEEGATNDTIRVLHESNIFIDESGKPVSISPKNFDEGNFELIKLNKEIDSKYELDGYPGFKVKYISENVNAVPEEDTIFVYSYKQLVNKNDNEVRIPFRETFDDKDGTFQAVFELVYPRYSEDYKVELNIGIRHTCYSERVAKIVGKLDGVIGVKLHTSGPKKGILEFTVKGMGDTSGDLFPKEKTGKKMEIKEVKNYSKNDETFNGIDVNYSKRTGDTCGPEKELALITLNIINAYKDTNGKPVKISGDWNNRTVKTFTNTKIRLGSLHLQGNSLVFKTDITRDSNKKSYTYTPMKNNEFQGVCDTDGKTIEVDLNKILGKDIDEFLVGYKDLKEIYFIFEEKKSPEYEKDESKFRTTYYKLELKDKTKDNKKDLVPGFGAKIFKKDEDLKKHYDGIKKDINDYYKPEFKDVAVDELTNMIQAYYNANMNSNPEIGEDLNLFKSKLEKINIVRLKDKPIKKIDNLLENRADNQGKANMPPNFTKDDILKKIDFLSLDLAGYLRQEGYTLTQVKATDVTREQKQHIVRWYDEAQVPAARGPEAQSVPADSKYKRDRYTQYGWLPISISNNMSTHDELFGNFMKVSDYNNGFEYYSREFWKMDIGKTAVIDSNFEINNNVPVIFLERQYDIYSPKEEPPIIPDKETKRNLRIIHRFYDKDGLPKFESAAIVYENLPEYINRLGWRITDYRPNGYTYMNAKGENLKEGDVKYSEKLENKTTKTLYIDYKGEGDIPPIIGDEYGYKIIHQLVDLANPNNEPQVIGSYQSNRKYQVGTELEIMPVNREAEGYVLIDENNQVINEYKAKTITIKDEKRYGNTINTHYYRYAKAGEVKNSYRVQYTDPSYKELASSELRSLAATEIKKEEVAKIIPRYTPRIGKINLEIGRKVTVNRLIHFIADSGYTVKAEGQKYLLYRNNLRCAEILSENNENVLRFIYDRASDPVVKDDEYRVEYVDSDYRSLADSVTRTVRPSDRDARESAKSIRNYEDRISRVDLEIGTRNGSDEIIHFADVRGYEIRNDGSKTVLYKDRLRCAEILEREGKSTLRIIYDKKRDTDTDGGGGGGGGGGRTPGTIITDKLDRINHKEYIQGYPDNTVRPDNYITREEVAAVFYRLLNENYKVRIYTLNHKFKDVNAGRWSQKHIATLNNGQILNGYEDGSFRPGMNITRAEVAAIASRFDELAPSQHNLSDVKGHWAEKYIGSAVKKGWIKGYPDGSFKPDQYITRSEFVTLVNAVLERKVKEDGILTGIKTFKDLKSDKWYYLEFVEATNGHIYNKRGTIERWLQLKKFEYDM